MSTRRRPARTSYAPAFTLIELIVVISIIAILASIALIVGGKVTQQARANTTKNLLHILDNTQVSLNADRDGKAPWKYTDESAQANEYAAVDGRMSTVAGTTEKDRSEPSLTFYLLATKEVPSVQSAIGNFDARYVARADVISNTNAAANAVLNDPKSFTKIITYQSAVGPLNSAGQPVAGLVIKDPWGNAIRYVHPKFDGGYGPYAVNSTLTQRTGANTGTFKINQNGVLTSMEFYRSMRRSLVSSDIGDADEGLCQGSMGYFYSPGLDRDPGTRDDNVYLNGPPSFPKETANLH